MSNVSDSSNKQPAGGSGTSEEGFLELYKSYVLGNTEAPTLFHIWCAICGVAATLGKSYYLTRGHFRVYPNLYVMLIGSPGTGKGTCINILQNLLLESGYRTFAADKSSKEKFLLDFHAGFSFDEEEQLLSDAVGSGTININGLLSSSFNNTDIFAGLTNGVAKEVFIVAEEFNDFIGHNNIEFISLLTKLWSYEGIYRHRLKNSRSVCIHNPCINILGGNTSASFALAFPPEIIGQGFLARLLPIYGEPTGKRITFPERPSTETRDRLAQRLGGIRENCKGEANVTPGARDLLERINMQWRPIEDSRFQHYAARRFNQLLKLCLIFSAFSSNPNASITERTVRSANTVLTHTEELMPKAIGEFGKAKNADVTSKIMELLWQTDRPLTTNELWKLCSQDLNQFTDLGQIIANLKHADKIQAVQITKTKEQGWLPKNIVKNQNPDFIDMEFKKGLV